MFEHSNTNGKHGDSYVHSSISIPRVTVVMGVIITTKSVDINVIMADGRPTLTVPL